jgi:uncharacterized protein (TIGR03083 family)
MTTDSRSTAMHTNVVDVTTRPPLDHDEAMALLAVELDRTLDLLRTLDDQEWTAATACPDWDVHHMYLHVLGACEAAASMRENAHQMRLARRHRSEHGGPLEAGLSNVQVRERADASPAELIERLTAVAPRTVHKRTTTPALMRRMRLKVDGPVVEKWSLGYLIDTIYLRDLWMHRVDAARATGHDLVLTADHDGRIIADVVAEWARRHGRPFALRLSGPAGGVYTSTGTGPASDRTETLELEAVEFCRTLAGRSEATGLLTTIVPF